MFRYILGILLTVAGILHFITPRFYLKIMPPYLPYHSFLVFISGVSEVILGVLLLLPNTSKWAAWGIILLLVVVFPANIYMAYGLPFQNISPWIRWGRLPLQFLLIWWAYQYTK